MQRYCDCSTPPDLAPARRVAAVSRKTVVVTVALGIAVSLSIPAPPAAAQSAPAGTTERPGPASLQSAATTASGSASVPTTSETSETPRANDAGQSDTRSQSSTANTDTAQTWDVHGLLGVTTNRANDVLAYALSHIGVRYRRGGNSPERGFDCSGLVRWVYNRTSGIMLPRRADQIAKVGTAVPKDQLQPGDLVFFNTLRRTFSHVGIYLGDGQFLHAPRSGGKVRVENLDQTYWKKRWNGARRLDDGAGIGVSGSAPLQIEATSMPLSIR